MTDISSVTILGIDPGIARCGFGVIRKQGQVLSVLESGVIFTPAKTEFCSRLAILYKQLQMILYKYQPNFMGVEELYFCKNVKTALDVGHARGVILLAGMQAKAKIFHFTPLQVKQAVTSYGKADKKQVSDMVRMILNLPQNSALDDETDALAVAICCANSLESLRSMAELLEDIPNSVI